MTRDAHASSLNPLAAVSLTLRADNNLVSVAHCDNLIFASLMLHRVIEKNELTHRIDRERSGAGVCRYLRHEHDINGLLDLCALLLDSEHPSSS